MRAAIGDELTVDHESVFFPSADTVVEHHGRRTARK